MAPVANPTRSSKSHSLVQRRHSPSGLQFEEVRKPIDYQWPIHKVNAPERTRSRALAEATRVDSMAEAAAHRSLSFSEYSDYHEPPRAATRIIGSVSDAAPTELDWEIGG